MELINVKEIEKAIGLTSHQIRHRREKPEYQRYLEIARQEQRKAARGIFTQKEDN